MPLQPRLVVDNTKLETRFPTVRRRRVNDERRARDILLEHEPYRSLDPQELGQRIDIPLELGHAHIVDDRMFVSWMWPEVGPALERQLNGLPPEYDDWEQAGPMLWLVDVAARPGTSGTWVGRRLSSFLARARLARVGEKVAFRRHQGRRFGWATVRG